MDGDAKVGLDMFIGHGRMQAAEQVWKDMVDDLLLKGQVQVQGRIAINKRQCVSVGENI